MTLETGLRSAAESVPLDWEAVRVHLARHGHRLDAEPLPRQFAGGLANLNYLIHLDGKPAVPAPDRRWGSCPPALTTWRANFAFCRGCRTRCRSSRAGCIFAMILRSLASVFRSSNIGPGW